MTEPAGAQPRRAAGFGEPPISSLRVTSTRASTQRTAQAGADASRPGLRGHLREVHRLALHDHADAAGPGRAAGSKPRGGSDRRAPDHRHVGLLQEKTKGNLTPPEENMLQNILYELRMAYLEVTNLITNPPQGRHGGDAKLMKATAHGAGQRHVDGRAHHRLRLRGVHFGRPRDRRTRPSIMVQWDGHTVLDRHHAGLSRAGHPRAHSQDRRRACTPTATPTTSSDWTMSDR